MGKNKIPPNQAKNPRPLICFRDYIRALTSEASKLRSHIPEREKISSPEPTDPTTQHGTGPGLGKRRGNASASPPPPGCSRPHPPAAGRWAPHTPRCRARPRARSPRPQRPRLTLRQAPLRSPAGPARGPPAVSTPLRSPAGPALGPPATERPRRVGAGPNRRAGGKEAGPPGANVGGRAAGRGRGSIASPALTGATRPRRAGNRGEPGPRWRYRALGRILPLPWRRPAPGGPSRGLSPPGSAERARVGTRVNGSPGLSPPHHCGP